MIEEQGVVVSMDTRGAVVETRRSSTCGTCQASTGCGTAVLQQVLGRQSARVTALAPFPVRPGDQVILGLDDGALLRGSVALYGLPLAGLFSGALVASWMQSLHGGAADWPVASGAAVGLAGAINWVRRISRRMATDPRYQSFIVRKAGNTATFPVDLNKQTTDRCS